MKRIIRPEGIQIQRSSLLITIRPHWLRNPSSPMGETTRGLQGRKFLHPYPRMKIYWGFTLPSVRSEKQDKTCSERFFSKLRSFFGPFIKELHEVRQAKGRPMDLRVIVLELSRGLPAPGGYLLAEVALRA